MIKYDLQRRTKIFPVDVIKLCQKFPNKAAAFETAKHWLKVSNEALLTIKSEIEMLHNEDAEPARIFNASVMTAKKKILK